MKWVLFREIFFVFGSSDYGSPVVCSQRVSAWGWPSDGHSVRLEATHTSQNCAAICEWRWSHGSTHMPCSLVSYTHRHMHTQSRTHTPCLVCLSSSTRPYIIVQEICCVTWWHVNSDDTDKRICWSGFHCCNVVLVNYCIVLSCNYYSMNMKQTESESNHTNMLRLTVEQQETY